MNTDDKLFSAFSFPWEKGEEPYYVDSGVEWYLDKSKTRYLHEEDVNGNQGLKNMAVFTIRRLEDNDINRVIIDNKQNIVHVTKSLEGLLCRIDVMKLVNAPEKRGIK
jgi:hypothetical protein